jgi:hypothetical protein
MSCSHNQRSQIIGKCPIMEYQFVGGFSFCLRESKTTIPDRKGSSLGVGVSFEALVLVANRFQSRRALPPWPVWPVISESHHPGKTHWKRCRGNPLHWRCPFRGCERKNDRRTQARAAQNAVIPPDASERPCRHNTSSQRYRITRLLRSRRQNLSKPIRASLPKPIGKGGVFQSWLCLKLFLFFSLARGGPGGGSGLPFP